MFPLNINAGLQDLKQIQALLCTRYLCDEVEAIQKRAVAIITVDYRRTVEARS